MTGDHLEAEKRNRERERRADADEERDQRRDGEQQQQHAEGTLFQRIEDGTDRNLGFVGQFRNLLKHV